MEKVAEMRHRLGSDVVPEVIQVIHEAGDLEIKELGPDIHRLLVETEDPRIRNVAAYALRTLGDPTIVPDLIRLIGDPKTQGNRGSLVFAIEPYSTVDLVPFLIDLVIYDNIEVQNIATMAIEAANGTMSEEVVNVCLRKLNEAIPNCQDSERLRLLMYILSLFDEPDEPDEPQTDSSS